MHLPLYLLTRHPHPQMTCGTHIVSTANAHVAISKLINSITSESAVGYNADMNITWVGDDIMDGLIGSITVGLNL